MNIDKIEELEQSVLSQLYWIQKHLKEKEFKIKTDKQPVFKKVDMLISVAQYIERKGINMRMTISDFSNSIDDKSLLENFDKQEYPEYSDNDNLDNGTITVTTSINWDSDLDDNDDGFGNSKTPFNGQAPF